MRRQHPPAVLTWAGLDPRWRLPSRPKRTLRAESFSVSSEFLLRGGDALGWRGLSCFNRNSSYECSVGREHTSLPLSNTIQEMPPLRYVKAERCISDCTESP